MEEIFNTYSIFLKAEHGGRHARAVRVRAPPAALTPSPFWRPLLLAMVATVVARPKVPNLMTRRAVVTTVLTKRRWRRSADAFNRHWRVLWRCTRQRMYARPPAMAWGRRKEGLYLNTICLPAALFSSAHALPLRAHSGDAAQRLRVPARLPAATARDLTLRRRALYPLARTRRGGRAQLRGCYLMTS